MSMSRVILLVVGLNTVITVGGVVSGYLYLNGMPAAASRVGLGGASSAQRDINEYAFYPVEKIVVNLPGEKREHYFVLDLALQAGKDEHASLFKQLEPLVRHSVISSLSALSFSELRAMQINEVQQRLNAELTRDFAAKGLQMPFSGVLVSKWLVQ
ncbi:Flagellar protein LafL [compost metagenome]